MNILRVSTKLSALISLQNTLIPVEQEVIRTYARDVLNSANDCNSRQVVEDGHFSRLETTTESLKVQRCVE